MLTSSVHSVFGSIVSGPVVGAVVSGSVMVEVVVLELSVLEVVFGDELVSVVTGSVVVAGSVVLGAAVVGVTPVGAGVGDVLELGFDPLVEVVVDSLTPSVAPLGVVSVVVALEEPSWTALEQPALGQPAIKQITGKIAELTRMSGHLADGEDNGLERSSGRNCLGRLIFVVRELENERRCVPRSETVDRTRVVSWTTLAHHVATRAPSRHARARSTQRAAPGETIRHMATSSRRKSVEVIEQQFEAV